MKNSAWQSVLGRLVLYGGIYILICGILFVPWVLFLVTPNVPPLWQQIVGCILLPFGLLIKIPANTYGGIAVCVVLNTLFWATLVLIGRAYTSQER